MSCTPPHLKGHFPDVDPISQSTTQCVKNTPQNYNKKMTYANNMSLFFIFFVFLAPFLLFVAENGTDEGKELFVMIGVRELCSPSLVEFHEAGMGLVAINNECFATGL